ncbi:MAG: YajQ family cyclic di-GMP-binding protein [bacterium TMED198]|nr:MAG: YajQ family cyclic di-GMP-binding protein [bacterium TMED198]|tara:strand:+ start:90 stop:581 length:492 start_codon:yes stop_codon:yes gene_type:complete
MPSFDITCGFDMQEMDNAVNMVKRDISNRYDFKGTNASLDLNKVDSNIVIKADSDYQMETVVGMLQDRAIARKLSIKVFKYGKIEQTSGMTIKQNVELQSGISKENSKKINTLVKDMKLKVSSQIQGEQIRVTGKKIDDLQTVMSNLKSSEINLPLQFVNMKK